MKQNLLIKTPKSFIYCFRSIIQLSSLMFGEIRKLKNLNYADSQLIISGKLIQDFATKLYNILYNFMLFFTLEIFNVNFISFNDKFLSI